MREWIDCCCIQVDGNLCVVVLSLDNASPCERIHSERHCRCFPHNFSLVVGGVEQCDGLAMVIVAYPPHGADHKQRANRTPPSAKHLTTRADFAAYESEDCRNQQTKQQSPEHDGFEDEDNVPGVPVPVKRQERTHAVVVGEIEQNVTEDSQNPKKEQQAPARREQRRLTTIHSPAMKCVDRAEHDC